MDDDKIQYLTRWLPENLSPNVKVVLSMINDTECHRLLRSYKSGPREITCGQLDYQSRKVWTELLKSFAISRNFVLDSHESLGWGLESKSKLHSRNSIF